MNTNDLTRPIVGIENRTAQSAGEEAVAWADVEGYESQYEISCTGDLRNKTTGKIQAKNLAGSGYVKASLWSGNSRKQTTIHRLVASAFVPNQDNKPEVNHKDGNKRNNHVSNLEWCTRGENERHSRSVLGSLCKPVEATEISTGIKTTYPSTEQAAREIGCPASCIWKAINGPAKTCRGRTWQYVEAHPPASEAQVRVKTAYLHRIASEISALKLHPATSEEYDAGYIAARNDAFAIVQEVIDSLPTPPSPSPSTPSPRKET